MNITQEIVDAFLARYPEVEVLGGPAADPDRVQERLEDAAQECGVSRWGGFQTSPRLSLRARGMFAYAAHRSVLDAAAYNAVSKGGIPEAAKTVQSKSIADESVSYSVPGLTEHGADRTGDLRTTIYGQEFLRLRKRVAAGAGNTGQHWRRR